MRSLRSSSALLAAMLVLGMAACSASPSAADFAGGADSSGTPGNGGTGGDAATTYNPTTADAGIGSGANTQNPLCGALAGLSGNCLPDDDAPPASNKCSSGLDDAGVSVGAPDGGSYDAGPSPIACHVKADPTTVVAPVCTAAGQGGNGAQCLGSDDCAAGFECVGSPGVCRHYCCSVPAKCDSGFYCDVQSEASSGSVKIPVCEPVHSCQLMAANPMCASGETCAIVNDDDGTTSCIDVGPAHVGQDCNATHCGKDLVCLGDLGSRKCFALCNKAKPNCDSSKTCMGSAPLFQGVNSGIGICQ